MMQTNYQEENKRKVKCFFYIVSNQFNTRNEKLFVSHYFITFPNLFPISYYTNLRKNGMIKYFAQLVTRWGHYWSKHRSYSHRIDSNIESSKY